MRYSQLEAHLSKPRNRPKIGSYLYNLDLFLQSLTIILSLIILFSVIYSSDRTITKLLVYSDSLQKSSNVGRIEFLRFIKSEALNKTLQRILTLNSVGKIFISEKVLSESFSNRTERCSHHSCFDIYKCETFQSLPVHGESKYFVSSRRKARIKVFIYPRKYFPNDENNKMSLEFSRILAAISNSSYYTNDPNKACLFIPNVDLLNVRNIDAQRFETILWSQSNFRQMLGSNHLLLSFSLPYSTLSFPSSQKHSLLPSSNSHFGFNIGNALVAAGSFDLNRYQPNFDISIPTYSIFSRLYEDEHFKMYGFVPETIMKISREYKIISIQVNSFSREIFSQLQELETQHEGFILFERNCLNNYRNASVKKLHFPSKNSVLNNSYQFSVLCSRKCRMRIRHIDLLHNSKYCLLLPDKSHLTLSLLSDYLMAGCIPVIVIDNLVLPFEEVIDWNRASIRIWEHQLNYVANIISNIPIETENNLRYFGLKIWKEFFSSPEVIALKVLDIINNRIFPEMFEDNKQIEDFSKNQFDRSFSNLSPKSSNLNSLHSGFTAVILSFNRIEKLFQIIALLNKVSSCAKIVVVWNSLTQKPPQKWPNVVVPLEVIQTHSNKLSNRFFPYFSIQTEAIFSIDDDITILNIDEIEFAFQTWLQFPDRIVGFPSRLHVYNNSSDSWFYDSEWRNQVSIILTGAAFYHRYYNFVYSFIQDQKIRDWIDKNSNCEDIAMNFLVSNLTCSAPIKVTPRKKFKCSSCSTTSRLSPDSYEHLQKRSECIEYLRYIYGHIPLRPVEFRANPVLFRDNIPDKLKLFGSIGQL